MSTRLTSDRVYRTLNMDRAPANHSIEQTRPQRELISNVAMWGGSDRSR
ncbi:MAG: hypothetical protein IIC79_04750 [Chloroflexi bacterium]|nr:hypothetical protein [Chloroflexota bacterium]